MPNWGTGEWDWKNFDAEQPDGVLHAVRASTRRMVNQRYLTSWNNKQAPGYAASDSNWSYAPLYRSQLLDKRIDSQLFRRPQDVASPS